MRKQSNSLSAALKYFLFLLQFHVIASYPRVWNMPQSWQCEIEVYKATYHFIYAQKNFFTGESSRAKIIHFVRNN